jgi:prophage maintenance system killer protein
LPNEPHWLPIDVVIEHNRLETQATGEPHFLRINGYDLSIDDSQPWADAVIELVERRTTEEDFVRILRPFVVPVG